MALTATYTHERSWIPWGAGAGLRHRLVRLTLPGGQTYGTGLALDRAQLGCPTALVSLSLLGGDSLDGNVWKWDRDDGVLRAYEGDYANAAEGPLLELDATDTPPAQSLLVLAVGY